MVLCQRLVLDSNAGSEDQPDAYGEVTIRHLLMTVNSVNTVEKGTD